MARPKKSKLTEQEVSADLPEVISEAAPTAAEAQAVDSPPPATVTELADAPPPVQPIEPEADRYEMDRYICVINNSEQASRISQAISHQRELQMWGVHQYDKNQSRNSYARSFYFKNRDNAVKALAHALTLLG